MYNHIIPYISTRRNSNTQIARNTTGETKDIMLVVWTLVGAVVLGILLKYLQRKKYNLPPGPPGLPFFGNIFKIDPDKPHDTITKWSEEYGDVFKITSFGKTTVILNSFDTIYEGLVTQANQFAGRPDSYRMQVLFNNSPDIVTTTFSPQWVFTKKLALQTLKMYGNNLENLEVISMDLITDMLQDLKKIVDQGPVDIFTIYHKCVTGIITSILYGEKVSDETVKVLLKTVDDAIVLLQPSGPYVILDMLPWIRHFPNTLHESLLEAANGFKSVIIPNLAERRKKLEPGHPICFADGLLDYQRISTENSTDMKLSDKALYGANLDMIFAGTFTTSTTINALIAVIVNKPEIQRKMHDEIQAELGDRPPRLSDRKALKYLEAAILEILRYSSIITLNVAHSTTMDAKINGYDIPKDTEVLFNLWKLHHNPEYWDQPWEFKPERYLDKDGNIVPADHINRRRLLAFGASRRVCVGETLARNRIFLMVASLVQHFEFLPAGPDEIPRHDPRDYKNSFGVEPHRYRVRVVARQ